jgi:hypothetical protein
MNYEPTSYWIQHSIQYSPSHSESCFSLHRDSQITSPDEADTRISSVIFGISLLAKIC